MDQCRLLLKKYWGHDQFRPLQAEIIAEVRKGNDVLALLPTGGGKSICFQLPALTMEGICIVISPLIALMKDQIEALSKKDIPSLYIHAAMNYAEVNETLQKAVYGNYKFLYLSPERLDTAAFKSYLSAIKPSLIAVDEAHCISQWGYDFRPSYTKISVLRKSFPKVPVIALTASATLEVQQDICRQLLFTKNHAVFQQSFSRPNLSYEVVGFVSKMNKLVDWLSKEKGSALVYCKSRKLTQQISDQLRLQKINADFYHAGLSNAERHHKQESWIEDKIQVMVCTNAFGMGIDKPNVRLVVHFNCPESLENYYQEAGRAGRDGEPARAVLLYDKNDLDDLNAMADLKYPEPHQIKKIYQALMNHFQVAAGLGEGQQFDFDASLFAKHFSFNLLEVTYGIQALSQDGLLFASESVFKPSSVVFTTDKKSLFDFIHQHPELETIINALLRTYGGIFDYPSTISTFKLSKSTGDSVTDTIHQLQTLHQYRVIAFKEQSDKPSVLLLKNRMYADDFAFNFAALRERKQKYKERLETMLKYLQQTAICRSVFIGKHFNDKQITPCGICDNCTQEKIKKANTTEFKSISDQILSLLKSKQQSFLELKNQFADVDDAVLENTLRFLMAEKKITHDGKGKFELGK